MRTTENLNAIILDAKLGRTRKEAQEDTCAAFGAALYDVLTQYHIPCRLVVAKNAHVSHPWFHSVVEVDRRYYDSMGEFSVEIYRKRARIHPKSDIQIEYSADCREDCYEQDFEEMFLFYVKTLQKSAKKVFSQKECA